MLFEHQISILCYICFYYKDHGILKTGIMVAKIQLCHQKIQYIQIANITF